MGSNSTLNLNGRVEKTDIPTLLRSVEKDKLTGELSFTRNNDRIDLYFLFGQLYHAKWRETTGVAVISELLGWRNGNYMFTEGIIPAQASISDDIERILAQASPSSGNQQRTGTTGSFATRPNPNTNSNPNAGPPPQSSPASRLMPQPPVRPPAPPNPVSFNDVSPEIAAFDLGSLGGPSVPQSPVVPRQNPNPPIGNNTPTSRPRSQEVDSIAATDSSVINDRIAPSPPANGYYRTRYFCLPGGEQMATSLVATGPQLEEELLHLSEVSFTGYVLGSPEVEGYPAVGICLLTGRFIHAFVHGTGGQMVEGEKAYRMILDQRGNQSSRFYWFYELAAESMRSAIALLTPPHRYIHLEARIIRFREMMQLLTDERQTGCLKITVPPGSQGAGMQNSPLAGDCAYMPLFQGKLMGVWTESNPRLANDGPLLQRFLSEPQAYIDLHTTATVAEPGLPLEALIGGAQTVVTGSVAVTTTLDGVPISSTTTVSAPGYSGDPPTPPVQSIDDDERQIQMITSISRMEATWTQMQIKDKMDEHTKLLALAGFVNEVLSLIQTVSGRRSVQEMINRGLRQELAPFRTIFQLLEVPQGQINIVRLLKEYELFSRDSEKSGTDFYRETGRAFRTLIRSAFQYYVSLIRQEHVRFECQEMYEVFLQEVVKKM